MQQHHNIDNSEGDLIYPLSPPFNISPASASSELESMFSRPSSLPHSRSISSDSMLEFVQRTHPSLDLYKSNQTAGPLQRPEQSTPRLSLTPPSAHRTQRSPTSRRFSRSHTYSDDEEEPLDRPLPENATEQERIDWRRRQNTLAARKSRKRKQDQMQQLQDDVQRLSKEKDVWRERALMMKQLLISHGLPSPNFGRWTSRTRSHVSLWSWYHTSRHHITLFAPRLFSRSLQFLSASY
jgi:type II secretory pathway component PulJ